ncbi:hypothetical protein FK178_02655 [Antarcticibacterium arcticum]|uniref:Lipoprotein n=1 Tax=Antarcticibacterium arcticum TaxID=2585771 RepID=A0A5B8YFG8_9FLAO|nr:hypothetical protein [Antarcticibacterium arcticum]QED36680.1 hypothetical protein FK178_02655 [Antarcticibacterium arcticum]
MKKLFLLPGIILFTGCATSISTQLAHQNFSKLQNSDPIVVLTEKETLPENSEFVGDIKIGDSGFTIECGYLKVIEDATAKAREAGANIIKIVELTEPAFLGSTCYRLQAKIYRNLDAVAIANISKKRDQKNKSRLPEDSNYALIHFYRPKLSVAALGSFGYKIKDGNDSILGRLRGGEKFVLQTKNFGDQSFFAITETKEEIKIKVEKGKEYFVRGGAIPGIITVRPQLTITENQIGQKEFEAMK